MGNFITSLVVTCSAAIVCLNRDDMCPWRGKWSTFVGNFFQTSRDLEVASLVVMRTQGFRALNSRGR